MNYEQKMLENLSWIILVIERFNIQSQQGSLKFWNIIQLNQKILIGG